MFNIEMRIEMQRMRYEEAAEKAQQWRLLADAKPVAESNRWSWMRRLFVLLASL